MEPSKQYKITNGKDLTRLLKFWSSENFTHTHKNKTHSNVQWYTYPLPQNELWGHYPLQASCTSRSANSYWKNICLYHCWVKRNRFLHNYGKYLTGKDVGINKDNNKVKTQKNGSFAGINFPLIYKRSGWALLKVTFKPLRFASLNLDICALRKSYNSLGMSSYTQSNAQKRQVTLDFSNTFQQ